MSESTTISGPVSQSPVLSGPVLQDQTLITDNTKFTTTNVTIAIIITLIVVGVIVTFVVLFSGSGSSGCNNNNKPPCTGGTLACVGSSWTCTCGGQNYNGIPCSGSANPVCSNGTEWSCVCGSGSGASIGSSNCQDINNGQYSCSVDTTTGKGTWSCKCGNVDINDSGNPNCHGGTLMCHTESNGQSSWQCSCRNPITGKFDKIPSTGPVGATVQCTEKGWEWECGNVTDDKSCNGPGLQCIGNKWSCKCPSNTCPVNTRSICGLDGNWSCKCGNNSLTDFKSKTNYIGRMAQVACNNDSEFVAICGKDAMDSEHLGPDSLVYCFNNVTWKCKFPSGIKLDDVITFFEDNLQKQNDDIREKWPFKHIISFDEFVSKFNSECKQLSKSALMNNTKLKKIDDYINLLKK